MKDRQASAVVALQPETVPLVVESTPLLVAPQIDEAPQIDPEITLRRSDVEPLVAAHEHSHQLDSTADAKPESTAPPPLAAGASELSKLLLARNARLRVIRQDSSQRSASTDTRRASLEPQPHLSSLGGILNRPSRRSQSPSASAGYHTSQQKTLVDMISWRSLVRQDVPSSLLLIVSAQHCHQAIHMARQAPTNRVVMLVSSAASAEELCARLRSSTAAGTQFFAVSRLSDLAAGASSPTSDESSPDAICFDDRGKFLVAVASGADAVNEAQRENHKLMSFYSQFWSAMIRLHRQGFACDASRLTWSITSEADLSERQENLWRPNFSVNQQHLPFGDCAWIDNDRGSSFAPFVEAFAQCPFLETETDVARGRRDLIRREEDECSRDSIHYYSPILSDGQHALTQLLMPEQNLPDERGISSLPESRFRVFPALCWFGAVIKGSLQPSQEIGESCVAGGVTQKSDLLSLSISRYIPRFLVFEAEPNQHFRRFGRRLVLAHGHILQHVAAVDGALVDRHTRSVSRLIPQVARLAEESWIVAEDRSLQRSRQTYDAPLSFERLIFDALAAAQQRRWQRVGIVLTTTGDIGASPDCMSLDDERFDAGMDALLQWQFPYPRAVVVFHGERDIFPASLKESGFEAVQDLGQALDGV